jgi:transposase
MPFPSDLSDGQWALVRDLFEARRGAPPRIPRRRMVEAILYLARTGAQWRYLPGEFGPWGAVWQQFRRWRDAGVWGEAMRRLAVSVRRSEEREDHPSLLLVDGQTVKGGRSGPGFHEAGGPGGRTFGAKRTILVDTIGCVHGALVTSARPHDLAAARELLAAEVSRQPRLESVMADRGYRGQGSTLRRHGVRFEIKAWPERQRIFRPLVPLWRVEAGFAQLGRWRRLSRSYEGTAASARTWIEAAACALMLERLAA